MPCFRADHLYVFCCRMALESITRGRFCDRIASMLKEQAPHLISAVSENLRLIDGAIGIDIDGVVQASSVLALRNASERVKQVILRDHVTSYWELVNVGKQHGMTDLEAIEFATSSYNNHDVYLNAPLMAGIKPFLEILQIIKKPHLFGSARPVEFAQTTKDMFARKLPWIKPESIFLGRKEWMSGGEYKSSLINNYGIGLYIEDSIAEANEMARRTDALILLVPQPWNKNEKIENTKRVHRLGEYDENAESWPILRFLATREARKFLSRT